MWKILHNIRFSSKLRLNEICWHPDHKVDCNPEKLDQKVFFNTPEGWKEGYVMSSTNETSIQATCIILMRRTYSRLR